MKSIFSALFLLLATASFAQVPLNATVYDCDSNSKNIQDVLGTGKALIIAHKGVDCSICRSSSGPLQTWAANNKSKVEVWGAMSYRYNPNSFVPACQKTKDWDSTYKWTDIFSFPDTGRSWAASSSPRYYVYSAIDSSIVFQGSSRTVAQDSALNHSTILVGIDELDKVKGLKINSQRDQLYISNLPEGMSELVIYDLNGRELKRKVSTSSETSINTAGIDKGIYILQLRSAKGIEGSRKLFLQ